MKAYEIGAQNGLDGLTLVERPDPVPGPGEAVLRVIYTALNHRDLLVLEGKYGARKDERRIPLSEGVGEVVTVGEGVTTVNLGDRAVFAHFTTWLDGDFSMSAFANDFGITHDGWLAELIRVPVAALVKVPDGLSNEQAAPMASAALTAWHAIVEVGKVKAGDLVLTLGTGGVSMFTLQLAKACGARVAITSSSDAKLELARSLGADITINYATHPDWAAQLMTATDKAGADIIVETGGQATLSQSIAAAATNGRIVLIGGLGGPAQEGLANFGTIIGKNLVLRGIAEGSRAMMSRLLRAMDTNGIQPLIDRIFPFEEGPAAYQYLKSGSHVGKILIKVA